MRSSSVCPNLATEIQGPTGTTLLPLSVKRARADLVGAGSDAAGPTAVPWQTTAAAHRDQG